MEIEREMGGRKIVPGKIGVLHLVFPESEQGRGQEKGDDGITDSFPNSVRKAHTKDSLGSEDTGNGTSAAMVYQIAIKEHADKRYNMLLYNTIVKSSFFITAVGQPR